MDQDHQERIRQRAHAIWESEGRPEGRDAHHWSQAEQELRSQTGEGDQTGSGDQSGGVQPGSGQGGEAGGDLGSASQSEGSQAASGVRSSDSAQTADGGEPQLMEQPPAKKRRTSSSASASAKKPRKSAKSASAASTPYLNDGP